MSETVRRKHIVELPPEGINQLETRWACALGCEKAVLERRVKKHKGDGVVGRTWEGTQPGGRDKRRVCSNVEGMLEGEFPPLLKPDMAVLRYQD